MAVAVGSALLVVGCADDDGSTSPPVPAPGAASPDRSGLEDDHQVIVTGLAVPWGLAFLPDGAALVTERDTGRVLRVGPELAGDELQVVEVATIEVDPAGEGGLLGVAVPPEESDDQAIFVYYSTTEDNRVVRLVPGQQPEPVLTGIPHAANHNGGQLAFGPDGYLYLSTGDAAEPPLAQDRDSLAGKILRMTTTGEPAPDNPFGNLVWAYGLRNVQGLAWDAAGQLWATELGADDWDELNLIEPGGNYGWPVAEGPTDDGRFVNPQRAWKPAEASCSGAAVLGTTLITACLRGQRLWLLELTESGVIMGRERPALVQEYGRLRAVAAAPDGTLWVSTSNLDSRLPGPPHPDDDRLIRLAGPGPSGTGKS